MAKQTLFLNTRKFAGAQFLNHPANSATFFNGELLFAASDGIYKSGGDNDGTTLVDGVETPIPINAHIVLPTTNMTYPGQKSPRSLIMGGRFDGQMVASITDEAGATVDYETEMMENADGTKLELRTDQRSRYFSIKIGNVEGSNFSLESASITFIPGAERSR